MATDMLCQISKGYFRGLNRLMIDLWILIPLQRLRRTTVSKNVLTIYYLISELSATISTHVFEIVKRVATITVTPSLYPMK